MNETSPARVLQALALAVAVGNPDPEESLYGEGWWEAAEYAETYGWVTTNQVDESKVPDEAIAVTSYNKGREALVVELTNGGKTVLQKAVELVQAIGPLPST